MHMTRFEWLLIGIFLAFVLFVGILLRREQTSQGPTVPVIMPAYVVGKKA